jgi:hypothetical protein
MYPHLVMEPSCLPSSPGGRRAPPFPTRAVGGVVEDEAQNIWVGEYVTVGQPSRRWYIFSPVGKAIGTLDLPAYHEALMPSRTELLDVFGGHPALLREHEDGALSVEVCTIERL